MKRLILCLALTLPLATAARALVPIETDRTIVDGFYAIGLADEVRKNCPSISPRWVRAYGFLKSLESYALRVGYTPTQIEALTKNKVAKEALRARIRADLAERGARKGSASGFCAVGREEIAKGSPAGRLIVE